MDHPIIIKFGKSNSDSYEYAIELAREFDNFSPADDNEPNRLEISASEMVRKFDYMNDLISIVRNWKTFRMYIDGHPLTRERFNKIKTVAMCANGFLQSSRKSSYCYINETEPGWECRLLQDVHLRPVEINFLADYYYHDICWFNFVKFKSPSKAVVDKDAITRAINNEIKNKYLHYCPYLNQMAIEYVIRDLPDIIDLNKDSFLVKVQYTRHTEDGPKTEYNLIMRNQYGPIYDIKPKETPNTFTMYLDFEDYDEHEDWFERFLRKKREEEKKYKNDEDEF